MHGAGRHQNYKSTRAIKNCERLNLNAGGEELWNGLVARHENFNLTFNGHVIGDGLAYLATATPAGRDVNQVLVNFQMKPHGGDG